MALPFTPYATPLVLLFTIVLIVCKQVIQELRNPLRKIPGPWYAKFTSLGLKYATVTGQRIFYVQSLHEKYGPYVRLSPNEVAVNEVKGFKQIHGLTGGFVKSDWYAKTIKQEERPVLFSMVDAKSHAARRRLFARAFSKTYLREHWEGEVRMLVETAVQRMHDTAEVSGTLDILKWWTFMASDVSAKLMFGDSFHTLEKGEVSEFIRVLGNVLLGNGVGFELPFVAWVARQLPVQSLREVFGTNFFLTNYAEAAVSNMKSNGATKNIFAGIVAEAEKGEALNDQDVKGEALGLIVAGTDTTAVSLTYLVWAVMSHPDIQAKLELEVSALSPGYRDADLEGLPLLNAVIQENMRLYGAAPGMMPRMVPPKGAELGGYYLPGQTTVITQGYSLHRDPQIWPDPLEFKPERWMAQGPSGDDYYTASSDAKAVYSPFGAGVRACIGINLASMELRLATAAFFRKFAGAKLAPTTTPESMAMVNYFLSAPAAHKCEITIQPDSIATM